MSARWSGRVVLGAMLSAAGIAQPAYPQRTRLPSDVLHDVAKGRLENPGWSPSEVEAALKPLLASAQTINLSPEEEVALGLSYFFTFDGLSAKLLLEKHQARTDRLGRASWQSLQQMAFFGAKDYALVERRTKEFRRQFPAIAEDPEYTFRMVDNLARQFASQGDHPRAVSLILEDIQTLPLNVPFRSFELLAIHFASFTATGQAALATDWMRRHRDALKAVSPDQGPVASNAGRDTTAAGGLALPHRPGVIHYNPFVDRLYQDSPAYDNAVGQRLRRERALAKLERWIVAAERGDSVQR